MTSDPGLVHDSRIHAAGETGPRPGGEFVLYWMQGTFRAHDNFALAFAVEQANRLGVPVLVYHGLRRDYPWASDRLHSFILESVVDLYADFSDHGIQYAFYLDRDERPPRSPLVVLAERAALVVTDYLPGFIHPRQTRSLRRKVETPVVAVDSCTIVPIAFHRKEYLNAPGFRAAMRGAIPAFLHRLPDAELRQRRRVELPFDPLVPTHESIPAIVAGCDVDHLVSPAREIRGGTVAARARLRHFVDHLLPHYEESRQDPNLDGTSWLSPYLHFGNLSPHDVLLAARETGPVKQVARLTDEMVIWRELCHNFVHYNPRHRTEEGLPAWARKELAEHEQDPRPALFDDETLEYARTGVELWDAAQRAYLVDGWMHNFMRILWGKAVVAWTPNAAACLRILEHLNNKYSLDGRDPSTWGNVLWVCGKFDRPFYRRPIYGTVRSSSLNAAYKKFDAPAYIARYAALATKPTQSA